VSKSLYPTKLRKGDAIYGDGWSATWDGKRFIWDCAYERDVRWVSWCVRQLHLHLNHDCLLTDDWWEQTCIAEQLIAEGVM